MDLFKPIKITVYVLLRIVCILLYFHGNCVLHSLLGAIVSHAVPHETSLTERGARRKDVPC